MGNAFLKRLEAARAEGTQIGERIARQYDIDTLNIALARYSKINLGYKRIMEINELWESVRLEYQNAIIKHNESDVARSHMDEELLQIAKDESRITPFEQRYPELKKITYEGKKR